MEGASADAGTAGVTTDGRRARRDRNREAVVRAVVELFDEQNGFPGLQDVADRSGVSLRSVHRYFEDADAIVIAAAEAFVRDHADVMRFEGMPAATVPFDERVAWFVDHRVREHPITSRVVINGKARAVRDRGVVDATEAGRRVVIDAIDTLFAPELDRLDERARRRAVATVHTSTMAETWENLVVRHRVPVPRVRALWLAQVRTALTPGATP